MRIRMFFPRIRFVEALLFLFAQTVHALTATYSYQGNNFVDFDGEPGVFSSDDRVTAQFTLDCAMAHPEGSCRNLPYADYLQSSAVRRESIDFSAGPARLPTNDGDANIDRFFFSTDSSGRIVDWDMELIWPDPSGIINVDTDNQGDGLDSAAALGAGAVVVGQPGNWSYEVQAPDGEFDILVSKTADNSAPTGPLQTVEFTIEVSNIGSMPADDVVVQDQLPPELAIPAGMSPVTSTGYYDPVSGRWEVGVIEPGLPAETLTIPVVITMQPQPVCVVNTAIAPLPDDANTDNNSATAALRRPDIARCVDLGVEVSHFSTTTNPCAGTGSVWYQLKISNAGPDEAHQAVLELSETQYQAPGFKVYEGDPYCEGLRCTWPVFGAGQSVLVDIFSEEFQLQTPQEHVLEAVLRSDIEDYRPANNTLVDQNTLEFPKESCDGGPDWDLSGVGAGGGCFIATATYGSPSHPDVQILRDFRDDVLAGTDWGRRLIAIYDRYSPGLACTIDGHDALRMLVRGALVPVVFAVAYPGWALLLSVTVLALLAVGARVLVRRVSHR